MQNRIYVVEQEGSAPRLVKAASGTAAIRHVVKPQFKARVVGVEEYGELLTKDKIKVEVAGGDAK